VGKGDCGLAGCGVGFAGVGVVGLDGDFAAAAFEAAEVVAGLAAGVHALFVVVRAEDGVFGFGVNSRAWMMVGWELPVATRAFLLGMRRARRRYLAPGKDGVRLAPMLVSPRAALR
jgi:hypothetical protein